LCFEPSRPSSRTIKTKNRPPKMCFSWRQVNFPTVFHDFIASSTGWMHWLARSVGMAGVFVGAFLFGIDFVFGEVVLLMHPHILLHLGCMNHAVIFALLQRLSQASTRPLLTNSLVSENFLWLPLRVLPLLPLLVALFTAYCRLQEPLQRCPRWLRTAL
jgi:hypothetical protein